jgi:hypothetical protein
MRRQVVPIRLLEVCPNRVGDLRSCRREPGLARDAAIELLKAGTCRYWKREVFGHNKFSVQTDIKLGDGASFTPSLGQSPKKAY